MEPRRIKLLWVWRRTRAAGRDELDHLAPAGEAGAHVEIVVAGPLLPPEPLRARIGLAQRATEIREHDLVLSREAAREPGTPERVPARDASRLEVGAASRAQDTPGKAPTDPLALASRSGFAPPA